MGWTGLWLGIHVQPTTAILDDSITGDTAFVYGCELDILYVIIVARLEDNIMEQLVELLFYSIATHAS